MDLKKTLYIEADYYTAIILYVEYLIWVFESMSAESINIIGHQVLEEKFSAGLLEFETLIQGINEDNKSKLIDLLMEFTEE